MMTLALAVFRFGVLVGAAVIVFFVAQPNDGALPHALGHSPSAAAPPYFRYLPSNLLAPSPNLSPPCGAGWAGRIAPVDSLLYKRLCGTGYSAGE